MLLLASAGRDKKARALFAEFAPTLDFYEDMIGPYPWYDEKVGVVETPHLGMEHQTINAYGNNYAKTPTGFDGCSSTSSATNGSATRCRRRTGTITGFTKAMRQYMQPLYGRWREGEARYAAMMDEFRSQIRTGRRSSRAGS